jgi:hypothetical protein
VDWSGDLHQPSIDPGIPFQEQKSHDLEHWTGARPLLSFLWFLIYALFCFHFWGLSGALGEWLRRRREYRSALELQLSGLELVEGHLREEPLPRFSLVLLGTSSIVDAPACAGKYEELACCPQKAPLCPVGPSIGPGGRYMAWSRESPMLMTTPLPPPLPFPFHPLPSSQDPLPESQWPLPPEYQ